MMNEQAFFHWDLIRPPLQPPAFGMGASLLDFSYFADNFGDSSPCGILELRKEKSRDAARSRRGKENYEFYELAKLLPLPAAITSQLDKASIIRLSISYLKLQEFSAHGDPPWNREYHSTNGKTVKGQGRRRNANIVMDLFENHQGTHILQSLDGFAFALSNDGRFLYISETVSIYLGLSQVEVTGSSIFDYVHTQDHQELAEQLGIGFPYNSPGSVPSPNTPSDDGSQPSTPRVVTPPSPEKSSLMISNPERGPQRTFCMRMKSTLTKRGVHVRTSGYRVVYVVGQMRPQICFSLNRKQPQQILGMVGVAIALPPPTVTELRIESDTFILRLSPALRVLYCDTAISEITDWSCDDISNKVLYDFCHPADLNKLRKSHLDITTKGQVLSEFFRLINKCGGYVWVQMCGTTLFTSKTSDDHTVLAIIYVLSGVEYRGCVMDTGQLTVTQHTETDHSDNTDQSEQGSDHGGNSKDDVTRNSKSPGDCDDRDSSGVMGVSPQPCDGLKRSVSLIEGDIKSDGQSLPNQDKDFISNNNNSMQADILYSRTCVQGETTSPAISNSQGKISTFKNDFKYSRRKTDRPRKRRREFEVESCTEDEIPSSSTSARLEADTCGSCNDAGCDITSVCQSSSSRHISNGRLSASNSPDSSNYVSTLPEDLSLNSFSIRQVNVSSTSAVSSCESHSVMQTSCWQNGSTKDREHNSGASSSTSSVKDLEDVMNKHLPHISSHIETGLKGSSDLTARHLSPGNMQKSRSTVQWRGTASENDPLPASNLLRTLYANRESVIRSNTRPQCFNGDNSNSGVSSVDMLTPPGSDGGLKEQLTLNIPQITVSGKTVSAYHNPLSVSVHNTVPDTFSITPPSSVSPEDKATAPFVDGNYNPAPCNLTPTNSLANPVPVKSQTFSISLPTQVSTMPDYSTCSNKINYSNMAAYNMADYQQYVHSGNQGSVIMYDTRPESWYPVSYPS